MKCPQCQSINARVMKKRTPMGYKQYRCCNFQQSEFGVYIKSIQ